MMEKSVQNGAGDRILLEDTPPVAVTFAAGQND